MSIILPKSVDSVETVVEINVGVDALIFRPTSTPTLVLDIDLPPKKNHRASIYIIPEAVIDLSETLITSRSSSWTLLLESGGDDLETSLGVGEAVEWVLHFLNANNEKFILMELKKYDTDNLGG